MMNFTVGPVQMNEEVRALGAEQIPYFRTDEFSAVMKENERLMLKFAHAAEGSRAVFLTGSGTAGMEAAVVNTLDASDRAIVVDGGSFGHRFVQLCEIHGIAHEAISLDAGQALTPEHLAPYEGAEFTAFLVNLDETSTGVLYDLDMIARFCERNGMFLIVDAVSAFLADPIDMAAAGVGVMITGSQKALATPPGVSILVLSPQALERIGRIDPHCLYLNVRLALENGERGQTPFTPAVGTLLQIHERLVQIDVCGADAEIERVAAQARDFRARIEGFGFEYLSQSPANGVTALRVPQGASARAIFATLKDEYGIWVCPNGGELADTVFRVGHIGDLSIQDNEKLVAALSDLRERGMLGAK